jgi:outer membrane murein-binding lipoprotein Lpp
MGKLISFGVILILGLSGCTDQKLKSQIEAVSTQMTDSVNDMRDQIDQLDEKLNQLEENLDKVRSQAQGARVVVPQAFDVDQRVRRDSEERIQRLESHSSELEMKVSNLEYEVALLKSRPAQ